MNKWAVAILLLVVSAVGGEQKMERNSEIPTLTTHTQAQPQTFDITGGEQKMVRKSEIPTLTTHTQAQPQTFDITDAATEKKEQEPEKAPAPKEEIDEESKALMEQIKDDTGKRATVEGREHWEVTMKCLDCLCKFATDCAVHRGCETPLDTSGVENGMEKGDCGPFHISLPFWADAFDKTLVLGDALMELEWKKCALNLACSTEAIQKYIQKYPIDCNKDGEVDCIDYAAIHSLGPFGCQYEDRLASWNRLRRKEILSCMAKYEEGVYAKAMHEYEEKKNTQDIAASIKKSPNKAEKKTTAEEADGDKKIKDDAQKDV